MQNQLPQNGGRAFMFQQFTYTTQLSQMQPQESLRMWKKIGKLGGVIGIKEKLRESSGYFSI